MIANIENEVTSLDVAASLLKRQEIIRETDQQGIIATPANSSINELVTEAARLSILNDGDWAKIVGGEKPHVEMR
jgi:ABC-type proline/glycine betaine transport system ATPase subunit